jgi:hypothetical protein
MPVLPAGIQTSAGATAPARAGAATLLSVILLRTVFRSELVKTKPMLPLTKGRRRSYSGCSGMKVLRARRIWTGCQGLRVAEMDVERGTYHGVLAHEDDGILAESLTNLVGLLRRLRACVSYLFCVVRRVVRSLEPQGVLLGTLPSSSSSLTAQRYRFGRLNTYHTVMFG